jgi:hypothetical protein
MSNNLNMNDEDYKIMKEEYGVMLNILEMIKENGIPVELINMYEKNETEEKDFLFLKERYNIHSVDKIIERNIEQQPYDETDIDF